jgi:hypothetical protein
LGFALGCLLVLASGGRAAPPDPAPDPYVYVPRAQLLDVKRAFVHSGTAPLPGAGLHSFRKSETGTSGTERFEVHWYANPPGIPPGVVLLLEFHQERNAGVKNQVLRVNDKSEGNIRSVIEIPPDEVRRAGRVLKWRVRVVWRGRLLASQTSGNWEG